MSTQFTDKYRECLSYRPNTSGRFETTFGPRQAYCPYYQSSQMPCPVTYDRKRRHRCSLSFLYLFNESRNIGPCQRTELLTYPYFFFASSARGTRRELAGGGGLSGLESDHSTAARIIDLATGQLSRHCIDRPRPSRFGLRFELDDDPSRLQT